MTRTIPVTQTLEIGALYLRKVKVRLDQLGLRYTEHRGFVESIIVIKASNEAEIAALRRLMVEFRAFQQRLQDFDDRMEREDLERKNLKELARKNRWRRLTFRKPLKALR